MDDVLDRVFSDLKKDTFLNLWEKEYKRDVMKLTELSNSESVFNEIYMRVENTKEEPSPSHQIDIELHLSTIALFLLKKIDLKSKPVECLIEMIVKFCEKPSAWLIYRGSISYAIIKEMYDEKLFAKLDSDQFNRLCKAIEIKLEISIDDTHDTRYIDKVNYVWQDLFQCFVISIGKDNYVNNIDTLRHLYEYVLLFD